MFQYKSVIFREHSVPGTDTFCIQTRGRDRNIRWHKLELSDTNRNDKNYTLYKSYLLRKKLFYSCLNHKI